MSYDQLFWFDPDLLYTFELALVTSSFMSLEKGEMINYGVLDYSTKSIWSQTKVFLY